MRRVQFPCSAPGFVLVVVACLAFAARESRAELRIPFEHQVDWWGEWGGYGNGARRLHSSFSRDSRLFAIADDNRHSVNLWDLHDDRKVSTLESSADPSDHNLLGHYEFLGDGRTFAAHFAGGRHGEVNELRLFDVVTGDARLEINFAKQMRGGINFSPDGGTAIVWLPASVVRPKSNRIKVDWKVVVYDVATGKERKRLDTCGIRGDAAFSPDGKWLATVHASSRHKGHVLLWDAATLKRRSMLKAHAGLLTLAFSPDGKSLAAAVQRKYDDALPVTPLPGMHLWDVESGKERGWLPGILLEAKAQANVYPLFAPQGQFLVVSCQSGTHGGNTWRHESQIKLWNTADGSTTLLDQVGPNDYTNDHRQSDWWHYWMSAAFSPDGSVLATPDPTSPASVKFWETKYWRELRSVSLRGREERRFPLQWVGHMEFSPDGEWFAARAHCGRFSSQGEVVILKVSDMVPEQPGPTSAADNKRAGIQ